MAEIIGVPIGGTPWSCGCSWNPEDRCWLCPDGSCTVVPDWDEYIPTEAKKPSYRLLVIAAVVVIAVILVLRRE